MTTETQPRSPAGRPGPTDLGASAPAGWTAGGALVAAALLLLGAVSTLTGIWALGWPGSFADFAGFAPYNEHFIHDVGAFQLGLGVSLLLALVCRDGPAVALGGFVAGGTAHAISHWIDLDLGGSVRDVIGLLALAVLAAWALVVRLRQLGFVVGEVGTTSSAELERFVRQKTALLTTYRRNGRQVATQVSVAVEGDHAYFRTPHATGKAKRLAHTPRVLLAPSRTRGGPTGPAISGHAERVEGDEAAHAARLLRRKHPFLHGFLVPLLHRLMRQTTLHYRLTPTGPKDPVTR